MSINLKASGGLLIWRVRFDVRFESSSGMKLYHVDSVSSGLVATLGDSLEDVRSEIIACLGPQTRLLEIQEATFLGTTMTEKNR